MGSKQIRTGQLIAPFGPGSLYTDRQGIPHVVGGLDHWYKTWSETQGLQDCEEPLEFEVFEPRLAELLKIERFRTPPDYRIPLRHQDPPPNASLKIPALRFPRWYRNTRSGELRRFNLDTRILERPGDGSRWQPVRFIAVCQHGHLCEFPWKAWIDCQCPDDGSLELTDRGGSELSSIVVKCTSCPPGSVGSRGRPLSGTTVKPDQTKGEKSEFEKAGIRCPAEHPWLGEGAHDALCAEPLIGALINQTNIYFPRTISAISLPDLAEQDDAVIDIRQVLDSLPNISALKTLWKLKEFDAVVLVASKSLADLQILHEPDKVKLALDSLFSGAKDQTQSVAAMPVQPETEVMRFRRAEFDILREEIDDPRRSPRMRVRKSVVPADLSAWIGRVGLVERLCETRAFYGFDRIEPSRSPLSDLPTSALRQLFREPPKGSEQWLPAVQVYGEGIYLELKEEQIAAWQHANAGWLDTRLSPEFVQRLEESCWALRPLIPGGRDWASRFLLVHSLAHLLISQLVFECGYSTAALRERLFVSSDPAAPMAGMLIYTASGDSEGTLGGLVRMGQPELLGPVFQRALTRAVWCSADPVCSEDLGGQGSRLANLAACHACALLPETSCETINQGLDRGMLVGTPYERGPGIFSRLVDDALLAE
ncbi:DrmB family protein [Variovorax sp. 350MFTsu5.1]|uniref:DrmB family protein n=1 Tax=Variovorax sp. 350MFTsu5.1 TaxID=3158365 RepID=UPI003AAAA34C